MANPEHVGVLKQGAVALATWRRAHPGERLELREADLQGAHLLRAILQGAILQGADLQRAYLQGANLQHAYLTSADLSIARIDRHTKFDDVTVDNETKGIGPWVFNPEKYIIRETEFPPEYHQAGVGIMNYFATVLRQKYPDIPATVQISQEVRTVRMTIETEPAYREIIEKALEDYGLIVAGQRPPSALLSDTTDVIRLENQLRLTQVQLESERRALQLTEQQSPPRIESLEDDVAHLRLLVGGQLHHAKRLIDVLDLQAFAPLRALLDRRLSEADETEVKRLLTGAGQQNPHWLKQLADGIAAGAIGGSNAALLAPWLQEVAHDIGIGIQLTC